MVGRKIFAMREKMMLSQDQLGPMIGMTGGNLSRLEREDVGGMNKRSFVKFAGVANMTVDELRATIGANGHAASDLVESDSAERFLRDLGFDPSPQPKFTDDISAAGTEVLGEVAAGGFIEPHVYHSDEDRQNIPIALAAHPKAIALKIVGDSMEDDYHAGDYILCEQISADLLGENDDVVIQCDGENDDRATFKRVVSQSGGPEGVLQLKPLNGKHKPISCKIENVVRVLRVIGTYRPKR